MRTILAIILTAFVLATGLLLAKTSTAEADVAGESGRYVVFCCQPATPLQGDGSGSLRFGPCYETADTRWGRQCRQENLYYYPLAVRTDRTFTFDSATRELILFPR